MLLFIHKIITEKVLQGKNMKLKQSEKTQALPYSCLVDNIKVLLIFLVVFNHIIAFELV